MDCWIIARLEERDLHLQTVRDIWVSVFEVYARSRLQLAGAKHLSLCPTDSMLRMRSMCNPASTYKCAAFVLLWETAVCFLQAMNLPLMYATRNRHPGRVQVFNQWLHIGRDHIVCSWMYDEYNLCDAQVASRTIQISTAHHLTLTSGQSDFLQRSTSWNRPLFAISDLISNETTLVIAGFLNIITDETRLSQVARTGRLCDRQVEVVSRPK